MYDKYIDKTPTCHIWTGSIDQDGYGKISIKGVERRAHRIIYELEVGKIPKGLIINHLCRVRSCVNPKHLEATTHRINILSGVAVSAINARKTHCSNGHEFTPENTRVYTYKGRTGRACRTCNRHYWRKKNRPQ